MEKGALLYEGKAKRIYETNDPELLWIEYKDSATAFDGKKKAEIRRQRPLEQPHLQHHLHQTAGAGIDSHFVRQLSETEQLVKKVEIIPLETVVRNYAAGSISKRLRIPEGEKLRRPIVEFYYKDDALGDPLLTEDHIEILDLASQEEVELLKTKALEVNKVLTELFAELGVKLIDFKLEFGRDSQGNVLLADEISPDTCRLWDMETNEKLDKDVFRRDLGSLTEAYEAILQRLGVQ